MATEDERYRQSSQYRMWSFTATHLASLREQTNTLARTQISARLSSSSPPVDPLPDFLAPHEERTLLTHYTVELLRAAEFLKLPTDIRATAAIFLRRFYLTNSVMTYPPTDLLKTCLFFACKTEGFYFRLAKFADNFPNTSGEVVLAAEYVLSQGLRFAFDVRHPFRALEGAVMELRRLRPGTEGERINDAHRRSREILKFSPLVTDAYFHYTPSQIMMAALSMADEDLVHGMLVEAFAAHGGEDAREPIVAVIRECRALLEQEPPERMQSFWGTPESNKITKPLTKKLKKCRDPDRVDLVALQKAKREQALNKDDDAGPSLDGDGDVFMSNGGGSCKPGAEQPDNKRRKVANNDPFGPPL